MSTYKDLAGNALGAVEAHGGPACGLIPRDPRTGRFDHVWFVGVEAPLLRGVRRGAQIAEGASGEPGNPIARKATEQPDPFLGWLFAKAGLNASTYSPRFLQRRLPACLRVLRVESTAQGRQLLERKPELMPLAMGAVLIGVSSFFRDEAVFSKLRTCLLPDLMKTRTALRVCSIGCSEGQELYSMAMLLDEFGVLKNSYLLGVDCRPEAIARARAGCFSEPDLEGMPLELRNRFFTVEGSGMRVSTGLRENTHWEERNCLAWDFPQSMWDVVLFRNVAIYLNREEMAGLWGKIAGGLRPGGILVTGKAEQPPNELSLRRICHCLYAAADKKTKL